MALDLEFVRAQFPAFGESTLKDFRFFENAGGSYACKQVIDALAHYYTATKVQPYAPYPASTAAGDAMDRSRDRWAIALGVAPGEVVFGPSTSANSYTLANAIRRMGLAEGDEIIVTNQDHEANSGVWRRLSEAGLSVREWRMDAQSGMLEAASLAAMLSPRTRFVCMPAASNVIGWENPVTEVAALVHAAGARLIVDAVSYAPHAIPDVAGWDADVVMFSLYKVYGPHQGVMTVKRDLMAELANEGHFFNEDDLSKRLNPAGPDHAQVAVAGAVIDYIEALDAHHGGAGEGAARRVSDLWRTRERAALRPLLSWLATHPRARVLGSSEADDRKVPTVALDTARAPEEIAVALGKRGVGVGAGHFYAFRTLEGLGVDPARGALRLSFTPDPPAAEIAALMNALEDEL